MTAAIVKEIELRRDYLTDRTIQSIYFGGGTPSLAGTELLAAILHEIRRHYHVSEQAEITLEVNPDDVSAQTSEWRSLGFNRLSLGIQSFDNRVLTLLHRVHDAARALAAFQLARNSGFDNISIDLIYGIPGLSLDEWISALRQAIALKPEHISAYALTIEDRTVFGNWQKQGKLVAADEALVADQFLQLSDQLQAAGYEHYEISNFSLPGRHARHNSGYWRQMNYLGVGPSAHSFDGKSRQYNVRNNQAYLKSLAENRIPAEREILTRANKINEYILTGLRTQWGCDLDYLKKEWGDNLEERAAGYLTTLLQQELIRKQDAKLILTRRGRLFADKIAADFMLPEEK